jgi:eukaryotic-like serine/threonine-protein kinase
VPLPMIHGLDRDRWTVLSPLLDEALEMPAESRGAWLEGLRARDRLLAADLEALLARYQQVQANDFLEQPPSQRATLAGQPLGAYTLREPIGQGGMGSVWLAERSDGRYAGVAAVKLLNVSLIGLQADERFRREGHILARLRHRHIAHLIDAGISPAGQPYLVLEHVDGEHLDVYCDGRRLGIRERVRLFLDVLAAVSHAHANLIVHRDLKPSNVLVDRGGTVKLLDFGVAKLLTPDEITGPAAMTREGGCALTPEYAAPEQLTGGDITTATDVFALGVLLYELLSGRHPADPRGSPEDLFRAVLEREPERLSAAVGAGEGEGARTRGQNRAATPQTLSRALRGDLETIVAKALKKDPAERYASVVALADDLQKYLDHAPIRARPDTFAYRTAKFVRRHRLPVALAGGLLAALAAGLAGTLWQARAAARERDLALTQLVRAEGINDFTEFLLGEAFPVGQPVSVRDILVRAETLSDKRTRLDPALAVHLLVSIGDIYVVRDETDNARRVLESAYGLSRTLSDPTTRARATCAWARPVAMGGDQEGALRLIEEGLALTTTEERFDSVVAGCLLARTSIGMWRDSADLVSGPAREALRRLDRRPGAYAEKRVAVLQTMAMGHRLAGETAEADRVFARAFEQLRLLGREASTDAPVLLSNWASNTALTSPLAALEQNQRAVSLFGGPAPDAVPLPALQNLALQLSRLARYGEARAVGERARAVARSHGQAQGVALSNVRLAHACLGLGDLGCARDSLRAAEAGVLAVYPAGHRTRGDLLREQALLAEAEGRAGDAHRLMREAFAVHRDLKDKNLTQIETLVELSRLDLRLGSAADAEARARAALAIAETFRGGMAHSSWVGRSQLALGDAREAQGDPAAAHELFRQALEHMTPTLGATHPAAAAARQRLAR